MKNVFAITTVIITLALALTACGDLSDITEPIEPDLTEIAGITYDLEQIGGVDNLHDSTGIKFTFSESIDSLNLTAANIAVGERAAKDANATFTGSGTTWLLEPITVTHAGEATVKITKTGIDADTIHVTVYKAGEVAPTLTGITATYTGTAAIYPATPLDDLKDHLTVTAQFSDDSEETLSAHEYTLSVSGSGTLTVGMRDITVTYDKNGVSKTSVFKIAVTPPPSPPTIEDITYDLEQIGGEDDVTDSTGIVFTFSESVDSFNLTADNIFVGERAEKGANATFTGSGTTWLLEPITVIHAGEATVTINKAGIDADTIHVTVFKAGEFAPTLTGITATYNVTSTVYEATPLNDLKVDLTVKAQYSDNSEEDLSPHEYTLSVENDTLTIGANTITVTYTHDGITVTDEFDITVECDHDYQWKETEVAAETKNGVETQTCSICGETGETRPLYATGTAGLQYDPINSDTEYRVHKGTKPLTEIPTLHIPAYWRPVNSTHYEDYKPVTQIGTSANSTSNNAFAGTNANAGANSTLTELTFAPESQLTTIGNYAFQYCTNLSAITIPASVTTIGTYAFRGCTSLSGVTIPEGVTTISTYAFQGCTKLAGVTIPEGVTTIGANAFQSTGLTGITIPASVTTMGRYAFSSCTSLTSVTISEGVTTISDYAFEKTGLTGITIPASVTSIGQCAFENTKLTSITIPASVTTILDRAFQSCANLASITLSTDTSIGSQVFHSTAWYNAQPNGLVYLDKILYTYKGTMPANTVINDIREDTVVILGGAFSNMSGLTGITIPPSVTKIGRQAFNVCSNLTSIILPEGITEIGNSMFNMCTKLTSVNIPASVKLIDQMAFLGCRVLTEITIPEGVTEIGMMAFNDCRVLTEITIPASVTTYGTSAFSSCTGLTSATIYSASIGESMFSGCNKLATVTISSNAISANAFQSCTALTSVTFEKTIISGSFPANAFPATNVGDLRAKFYATNPTYGTPGTYTATGTGANKVWTLQ